MKRTLSTLLILTAILLAGCDRKGNSSLTKPPIAIEAIAPAVADQLKAYLGERFLKVGQVRFDESASLYYVEVFYQADEQKGRYTLEFYREHSTDHKGLIVYTAKFPGNLLYPASLGYFSITIDEMMSSNNDSQDAADQPAPVPESKPEGDETP